MSALQEPRHENVPNTVKGVWSDFLGEPLGSLWEALGTSGGSEGDSGKHTSLLLPLPALFSKSSVFVRGILKKQNEKLRTSHAK